MEYTWKTPMRAGMNGTDEDRAAREVDRLAGQAAAARHEDGRWTLHVMPDSGTFDSVVTISADDARALAVAVLTATMPESWAKLIEALALMGQHPADELCPTHCEHDRLTVMADPEMFTADELTQLDELSFTPGEYEGTFGSSRYGSA